ncbi:hypothetical protein EDB83DRAFT_2318165 [Lactarius deliciosus]|nr:hypothetical protein EDB83DRAFT_2318165 [Lactarius deliciosus]
MARAVHKCSDVGNGNGRLHRATGSSGFQQLWPPGSGTHQCQRAKAMHGCSKVREGNDGCLYWECIMFELLRLCMSVACWGECEGCKVVYTTPSSEIKWDSTMVASKLQRWGRAKSGALVKAKADAIASGREWEQGPAGAR